ncbi:MAG: F0F1 ATP synthase subunit A [Acidobacteriota bacterium]|nr:F0F1 ATP synthase subunit A [Acidobacteriota bacterium]MDH3786295.1 F0F1 ATP synthase subunit A [Acidobacteriota bacterium]
MAKTVAVSEQGAEHVEQGFDAGASIMHHVEDSSSFHLWGDTYIHLPESWELFGVNFAPTKHVVMMWLAGIVILVLFRLAARQTRNPVPKGIRNALEVMLIYLRDDVVRKAIPTHSEAFTGYLLTTFFFILTLNLIGLVPLMATATGNIAVTLGLAIISFLVIHISGLREFGLVGHFKNFIPGGVPWWLIPLIFPLEIFGALIKAGVLAIRLFANMLAGHMVILAFISLIFMLAQSFSPLVGWASSPAAVGLALFVYMLEVLVAFLQAFIFTMLTAQFIGMSVHPSH